MGGQQKDFISDIVFFQHQDGMRLKVRRHFLQCGEGPFILSTITYKVMVYAHAERADTLPLILLYPYINSGWTRCSGLYKGAFGGPGGKCWEQELTVQGLYSVENLKYVKTSLHVYQIRGTIRVKRHEIIGRDIHICMNCKIHTVCCMYKLYVHVVNRFS